MRPLPGLAASPSLDPQALHGSTGRRRQDFGAAGAPFQLAHVACVSVLGFCCVCSSVFIPLTTKNIAVVCVALPCWPPGTVSRF